MRERHGPGGEADIMPPLGSVPKMRCSSLEAPSTSNYHDVMQRAVEAKLYPSAGQEATLATWLCQCRHVHNHALDQRLKAYRRRGEDVSCVRQCAWLTGLCQRVASLRGVPVLFARDALRRARG
jgi:hypothetical protein